MKDNFVEMKLRKTHGKSIEFFDKRNEPLIDKYHDA